MAEEKKKRASRPTWTMVRELESKLKSAVAGLDDATAALKNARQQLQELKDSHSATVKSNKLMADELALRQSKIELLDKMADELAAEVERLKNRGFWERVFNR